MRDRVVNQANALRGTDTDNVYQQGHGQFAGARTEISDGTPLPFGANFRRKRAAVEKFKKLDEIPFDFTRRMTPVLVQDAEGRTIMLAKGASEEIFLRSQIEEAA